MKILVLHFEGCPIYGPTLECLHQVRDEARIEEAIRLSLSS